MTDVSLYQVYGVRGATNPHARTWLTPIMPPKSAGNRKQRRALVAKQRKG